MKVSESWLREWVSPSLTSQEMSDQLTMAGLEIDSLYPVAGQFDHVIVARVLHTRPHPQADKLTLCDVDTGGVEPIQVVCGAANVRSGLLVALAMIGANLPGGMQIKETKLRGELSQGMLCSTSELGIDERSEGILELPDDAPIGMDLRDYLVLNDCVFDVDLTPNRADCLSVLGIARELAALNKLPLKPCPSDVIPTSMDDALHVTLHAPEACAQYAGRIIRDINPHAVTPVWMKERLRRGGIRSLHPVVDITNYVMLELGQPMHAFDLQTIQGDIHVRYAQDNETLTLLDGKDVVLDQRVLVIADNEKALAMAGIMGGEDSAVKPHTTDIFLESAYFSSLAIAGVARRYGLSSDSSQRYERGVDPMLQRSALERVTYLLQSIVGGRVGPIELVQEPSMLPVTARVQFNPAKVLRLSGLDIPYDDMEQMLTRLGMTVSRHSQSISHVWQTSEKNASAENPSSALRAPSPRVRGEENKEEVLWEIWEITVPSHRFDIALDVDLVEEIIRLHGYEKIPSTMLHGRMQAGDINQHELLLMKIGGFLSNKSYRETISYSFVDPELQHELYPDILAMSLLNPISSELSDMRVGMWSGLLASMIHNIHRQQSALKLFESGVVFHVIDGQVQELPCIAGLVMGQYGQLNWSESSGTYDFYDVKGDLQSLFVSLNQHDLHFISGQHAALHPGKTAKIVRGTQELGWVGVLHPRLMDALDLHDDVILFELSLSAMLGKTLVSYQAISKYPQTRRDLSLIVDEQVSAMQIEQAVRDVVDPLCLKAFDIFDVYTGESIPENKKSLAIALTLQNDNRTLVDTEINTIIDQILKKLAEVFSVVLRAVS
ncbi:MAG: phenylalanine--tRNA ligase subunit beta [Legionellaceae bacterium]|nr:phenylalanine--tRNA ligase subunit beta [Legionellaceae bacterium]